MVQKDLDKYGVDLLLSLPSDGRSHEEDHSEDGQQHRSGHPQEVHSPVVALVTPVRSYPLIADHTGRTECPIVPIFTPASGTPVLGVSIVWQINSEA